MHQPNHRGNLTPGERLVKKFPSRHKDPQRASEQMRGLSNLVDLITPQSKTDLALYAAGPLTGKAAVKAFNHLIRKFHKDAGKAVKSHYKKTGYFDELSKSVQNADTDEYFLNHFLNRQNKRMLRSFPNDPHFKPIMKSEEGLRDVINEGMRNIEKKGQPLYEETLKERARALKEAGKYFKKKGGK